MRIVWLRPDKPENISIGRHRLAEILRDRGHDVSVWNTTFRDFLDILGASADVVIGTTRLGAVIGAYRNLLRGTPLVVDHIDPIEQFRRNHGIIATTAVSQAEKFAFRFADHVMVVYEEELPRVRRYAGSVTQTHLGVDFEKFANPSEDSIDGAERVLDENVPAGRKRLIYVGGLEPAYHVSAIVDAMEYLPDWDFIVLGDGSQRTRVEQANRENVHYLGTVPHDLIPGFLHLSNVGICLLDDRNTLKLLEYGAAGLPAVNVEGDAERRFEGLIKFCSLEPADIAGAVESANEDVAVEKYQSFTRQYSWEAAADDYEAAITRVAGAQE